MGKYISLIVRFAKAVSGFHVLCNTNSQSVFRPTGLGVLTDNGEGSTATEWYLGGRGLESFACQYITYAKTRCHHAFYIPTAEEDEQNLYLSRLRRSIEAGTSLEGVLSPCEHIEEVTGATVLDSATLRQEAMQVIESMFARAQQGICELVGTLPIAFSTMDGESHGLINAFRFVHWVDPSTRGPVYNQFIRIKIRKDPSDPHATQLCFFTESGVWLQGGCSLKGHVSSTDADLNLRRLSELTIALTLPFESDVLTSELLIDGRLFLRERERIEAAFANFPGR